LQGEPPCTSLAAASRPGGDAIRNLSLKESSDLTCMNMLCEKVGDACICRLSHVLECLPSLEWLCLAGNRLEGLPPSLWECKRLRHLDLSNNLLTTLPAEVGGLQELRILDISGNPLSESGFPKQVLELLPRLEELRVDPGLLGTVSSLREGNGRRPLRAATLVAEADRPDSGAK